LKMATQVFTITVIILGMRFDFLKVLGYWGLWLAVGLALVSAAQYCRQFWVQAGLLTQRRKPRPVALALRQQQESDVPSQQ
ncbi:MAG: hypothetical protein HY647_10895, partial [Acidobacteria bacterium]|nr:hypothetical protein [Acidobacteriota bacterium]